MSQCTSLYQSDYTQTVTSPTESPFLLEFCADISNVSGLERDVEMDEEGQKLIELGLIGRKALYGNLRAYHRGSAW